MPLPLVAIVGRPNVGKSTMFNRIIRDRLSITDDQPGVTRDRIYSKGEWNGREFNLIDTGGYVPKSEDLIETMVREQAEAAIEEADQIIFIVDARVGPTDLDREIAVRLLKQDKPVLLVANKADNPDLAIDVYEFMNLGLDEPQPISAANGLNLADMLDRLTELMPEQVDEPESDKLKIAILGRPNVGKSSLVNFLLGCQRQIVTDIPGTTRDAVDLAVRFEDREYILIDTAGLRRRSRIKENLEYFMTLRTIKALERCDVAMLLIEAQEGLLNQDVQIINQIMKAGKALVLCVNKWDLIDAGQDMADRYRQAIYNKIPTYRFIPIMFMSALTGRKVMRMFKFMQYVDDEQNKRIKTSELNKFLEKTVARKHPPAVQGKHIRLLYITQVDIKPPRFIIFSNFPKLIKDDYQRYLENQLRDHFKFEGVPIKIMFKLRKSDRND
ncbi:MAG: ribosome biogenesis GTPase Der [candidate division Zixibacteria bacterium]|nr:ribosome biogenesis GTPase Der [candidate division Zixibacteria bacterium]